MERLFPELDMLLRERSELKAGIGFGSDGVIGHRGEFSMAPAWMARRARSCGLTVIIRCRPMMPSKRNWPNMELATEWLMKRRGERGISPAHSTISGYRMVWSCQLVERAISRELARE